ncbi:MAG TPA: transaldolase [Actinopolymorphaceae bacterium]
MTSNRLRQLTAQGQAIWLDDLNRHLLDDGELAGLIDEDGLTGVTSNPTTFAKAVGGSDRYDRSLREAARSTRDPKEVFFRLAYQDIRDAADLLRGVWERTGGQDGFVSFELPPELAYDTDGSVRETRHHVAEIDRPNVLIKIPGTPEGVRAFEELTAQGYSINVTLLFAVQRYEEVAQAYLRGLERRLEDGHSIESISSVASFFVSRVDSKVDAALDEQGVPGLKGAAAVANAKLAYRSFQEIVAGSRWRRLAERGARVQRPLWASTSTKNPDYPDTLYVDELVGPDTINTMKADTLEAARDHARTDVSITTGVKEASDLLDRVRSVGVPVDDIVSRQLVTEGVDAFAKSFGEAVESVRGKLVQPAEVGGA